MSNGGFLVHYAVDTSEGQSGAPVYLVNREIIKRSTGINRPKSLIGVHVSGGSDGYNYATFLTRELRMWIWDTCEEMRLAEHV